MAVSTVAAARPAACHLQQRRWLSTEKPKGSLSGRVAIVTGSTSGIGLGIARSLLASGAHVMLNGFGDAAAIERTRAELASEFGAKVEYSGADMASAQQIQQMVQDTVDKLGGLDILVNNAGIQHVSPVSTFPAAAWDRVIAINLTSAFHSIQASLPHLSAGASRRAAQGGAGGRIINVASVHGMVASKDKSAYVAAKHGIIGLTKAVALEQANSNVTVNAIAPGWVLTPLVAAQIEARAKASGRTIQQEKEALLGEKQPMLDFSTPESLGALAVFLCQHEARTITGTTLTMDGGWTAQ